MVADEVRALAKRTSDSTGEIEHLLGTLETKTQEVTQKMDSCMDLSKASVSSIENARDSFEGIQTSVNEIRDQNLQISAAAEEQHSVAEEINRHIQQIYDEARLVESLANSAQDDSGRLSKLSDELNGLVGRFKSGGFRAGVKPTTPQIPATARRTDRPRRQGCALQTERTLPG